MTDAVSSSLVLGVDLSWQVSFNGLVLGLTYGLMAVGVILVYRSTNVINFAVAAMGAFSAALMARLVVNWGVGYWVAFAACVVVGGLIGAAIELLVVRRLYHAPRVILLVATLGVAQVLLFAQLSLPRPTEIVPFPTATTSRWNLGDVLVRGDQLLALIVIPLLVVALALFLNRTRHGIAIRASATNPDAARLAGIRIKAMSTTVWILAGLLAAIGAILTAPLQGASSADIQTLGPALLLRVLAAALIGRMVSLPWALAGGLAIGVIETTVFFNYSGDPGLLDVVLFVIVLATLLGLVRRGSLASDSGTWSFSPRIRPMPRALEARAWGRQLPRIGSFAGLVVAMIPLVLLTSASDQFLFARVLLYATVAVSVTLLTGWAGQLSLGQFAFVGLGAMTTAALFDRGLGFVPAVGVGVVVAAVAAMLVGAPALRMPGLFLGIATLAFAVAAPAWLLSRDLFTDGARTILMPRPRIGPISLGPQGTYYAACLLVLIAALLVASRIRRSGLGRALIAVRDNEQSAASLGLSPARVKLTAFGTAGGIAGLAGGMFAGLLVQFEPDRFSATDSIQVVAIAVIGGLASVAGAVLGALWVIGLPALFQNEDTVALLTSGAGLLVLLLYFPGGLSQILYSARDNLYDWIARRLPEPPVEDVTAVPAELPRPPEISPTVTTAVEVRDLTVTFGVRAVVDRVSMHVQRGEVVGLIGSNGAGKSTLMNAIGGFVPSRGDVEVLGRDVTRLSPTRRARAGLGRTFQGAQLFGDLTVQETIQVALQSRRRAGLPSIALGLPRARRIERWSRSEADEIIAFLGLGRYAERFTNELSTGTRRIVELAALIATGSHVLCLDEPTAGIAQRETEAFAPLILRIREELDASLLVIEHDMPLVMGISDRVYCLEAGRIISEGTPDEVRHDDAVIASYLGTDERAIARSGTAAPASTPAPPSETEPTPTVPGGTDG